jgi:sugar/nucleoside kinase (ribokinase family)
MTRRGILTGGTWCVDRNLFVDTWPEENGRALILSTELGGGGSGSNLAVAMRLLDESMPLATITVVGDDADGHFLLDLAKAKGIDHRQMRLTREAVTDYTLAFASQATGRRTHISFFGTSHTLTPDHFDFGGLDYRIFHLGLPGVHEKMDGPWGADDNGWVTTLRKARAAGLETNLELASIESGRIARLVRPCLPHLDYLVVNDAEIGGIAGIDTVGDGRTDVEACMKAAVIALHQGAMKVVAVHFPGGAVVAHRDGQTLMRPSVRVPPSEIKGANGAGDAFAAGFLYGMHEQWPIEKTVALAHATAAASLRAISTTGAITTWQTCLELADRWGWRESIA